jgi:hypothetical protein
VRMAAMSARNLRRARDYHEDILRDRRVAFYRVLHERTEAWLRDTGRLPAPEATAAPA